MVSCVINEFTMENNSQKQCYESSLQPLLVVFYYRKIWLIG